MGKGGGATTNPQAQSLAPLPPQPALGPTQTGAGAGETHAQRRAAPTATAPGSGLDRLEPVRTGGARPRAEDSQREAAAHGPRILAPGGRGWLLGRAPPPAFVRCRGLTAALTAWGSRRPTWAWGSGAGGTRLSLPGLFPGCSSRSRFSRVETRVREVPGAIVSRPSGLAREAEWALCRPGTGVFPRILETQPKVLTSRCLTQFFFCGETPGGDFK